MAIYDCFQYFNEDHMVDIRMSILSEYVDYFVISESTKTHQGNKKELNFNINNFSKYKHKIKYLIADFEEEKVDENHKGGESLIEQHQRNYLENGIKDASDNDLIILSDSDEIPDLSKLNQIKTKTKYTAFSQMMFMYKLNLQNLNESNWIGSKICKKKDFPLPQKLRDMKFKKYPFWRIDKKNIQIINGGWHFSFLQSPKDIIKKIKSYSHGEFNTDSNTNEKNVIEKILKNEDIFNRGFNLKKIDLDLNFPSFILKNREKLKKWII
jgi:beta-1,4-mannosyl-glycoprotein beta-1,4-N-acetylglucosaminyltransferase